MNKTHWAVLMAGAILVVGAIWARDRRPQEAPQAVAPIQTRASESWIPFRVGTFRQSAIEPGEVFRLSADTRGTPPGTWKHLGARRAEPIHALNGAQVRGKLLWPEGTDSSSLMASIVLSPHSIEGDPRTTADWIEVACLGTGPGMGKLIVRSTAHGLSPTNKLPKVEGDLISDLQFAFGMEKDRIEVFLNGRLKAECPFSQDMCFLYLLLSSDSNFPLREIQFRDLEIVQP